MEIEAEVTLTDTVKIHISADEAINAILQPPDASRKLLNLLNGICTSLREIPDEIISKMKPEQRKIVTYVLVEQLARFDT